MAIGLASITSKQSLLSQFRTKSLGTFSDVSASGVSNVKIPQNATYLAFIMVARTATGLATKTQIKNEVSEYDIVVDSKYIHEGIRPLDYINLVEMYGAKNGLSSLPDGALFIPCIPPNMIAPNNKVAFGLGMATAIENGVITSRPSNAYIRQKMTSAGTREITEIEVLALYMEQESQLIPCYQLNIETSNATSAGQTTVDNLPDGDGATGLAMLAVHYQNPANSATMTGIKKKIDGQMVDEYKTAEVNQLINLVSSNIKSIDGIFTDFYGKYNAENAFLSLTNNKGNQIKAEWSDAPGSFEMLQEKIVTDYNAL